MRMEKLDKSLVIFELQTSDVYSMQLLYIRGEMKKNKNKRNPKVSMGEKYIIEKLK